MKDFSLGMLRELLVEIRKADYSILRFDSFWKQKEEIGKLPAAVLLRHDVDRFPKTALETARLEFELGIQGTYFFRVKPTTFIPDIIRKIHELGHEVGYHYEALADSRGDVQKAFKIVERDLKRLREICPVVSASMHSRPFTALDGRSLWKSRPLEDFHLLGEAYLSVDHHRFAYLADSGRNWGGDRNVVWDKVDGAEVPAIPGTPSLIELVRRRHFSHLQILLHPNRWPRSTAGWASAWCLDAGINFAKTVIKQAKGRRHGHT